jgi:hypothetical protein
LTDVAQQIREEGWTQGDLIQPEYAERLCDASVDHLDVDCSDSSDLTVITQDCDLIRDLDREPYVELLVLHKLVEEPAPPFRGNSSRLLRLRGGRQCWFEASIHERFRVRKQALVEVSPSSDFRLTPEERRHLKRWLGRRYTREPFPDRFETNLAATSDPVKRLFKRQEAKLISALYIRIHDPNETQADYQISVILAVPSTHLEDSEHRDQVDSFEECLIDVFSGRPGICFHCDDAGNEDVRTMSEEDLTMAELRVFQRYDIDYRSVDDDTESPPIEV